MRAGHVLLPSFLIAACLTDCGPSTPGSVTPKQWTNGFWFWNGSFVSSVGDAPPVDVLYFQAGGIQGQRVYLDVPGKLPLAREYWMVFRNEGSGVPGETVASELGRLVSEALTSRRLYGLRVAGVQLDVDSPTGSLAEYAQFLRAVRKGLPEGMQISITALLDWFRAGTAISTVLTQVNEFVPQFYDVQDVREGRIASRIEGQRWGKVFASYKKRFRIGISTFGRARSTAPHTDHLRLVDFKPSDIASQPGFNLETAHTDAGELRLSYRPARPTTLNYTTFEPGTTIEFTMATHNSVRAAVDQAKQMGPYCAGVIFFRWPAYDETMAMNPEEVLAAAGAIALGEAKPRIRAVSGICAAVSCADVYVFGLERLSPSTLRYRITSDVPIDYFIPQERTPVKMAGPSQLELVLPPYASRSRLLLGRAVTQKTTQFSIEVLR